MHGRAAPLADLNPLVYAINTNGVSKIGADLETKCHAKTRSKNVERRADTNMLT